MPRRRPKSRRLHRFEALEARRVMAAYINELLIDPFLGSDDTDQYIEIRGTPDATLSNTYLVAVGGNFVTREGVVETVINLSGLTFGSNGYLVLTQAGNSYQVDPDATLVESVNRGFRGLPNNIFSHINTFDNRLGTLLGDETYFLIESSVPPVTGNDIDTNNDGLIDRGVGTVFSNWNVLDSISMLDFSLGNAYGQIVYTTSTNIVTQPGATIEVVDRVEYAGRIGESTGHSKTDWVGGTVRDLDPSASAINNGFRIDWGSLGRPSIPVMAGKRLDHIGDVNFTGGIRGTTFYDLDRNGQRDVGEAVLTGVTILADTNGNKLQDTITTILDPETYADGFELTNEFPGATLTASSGGRQGGSIEAVRTFLFENAGQRTFSDNGFPYFYTNNELRVDFERPVRSVTVDFVGSDFATTVYGRIDAFDAAGNSLGFVRSGPLGRGQRGSTTFTVASDQIAYVLAYCDSNFNSSSILGKVDRVLFVQGEAIATSDSNGNYQFNFLQPDDYELIANGSPLFQTTPLEFPVPATIDLNQNLAIDFGFGDNTPPTLIIEPISITENPRVGKPIGRVRVIDPNVNQPLSFVIDSLTGSASTPQNPALIINPATGELYSNVPEGANFEAGAQLIMQVTVTDNLSTPVTGTYTITITDVNEAPIFNASAFPLVELATAGTVIGNVQATDQDAGGAGVIRYDIFEGDPLGIFSIDHKTGDIILAKPELLDFETLSSIRLSVAATDGAPFGATYTVPNGNAANTALASAVGATGKTAVLALSGNLPPRSSLVDGVSVGFIDTLNVGTGGLPVLVQTVAVTDSIPTSVTVSFPDQTFATFTDAPIIFANPTGAVANVNLNPTSFPVASTILDLSGLVGNLPEVGQLVAGTGLNGLVRVTQLLTPTIVRVSFSPQVVPSLPSVLVSFYEQIRQSTAIVNLDNLESTLQVGQYLFGTKFTGIVRIESINAPGVVTVGLQQQTYAAQTTAAPIQVVEVLDPQRTIAPVVIDLSNTNEPPEFFLLSSGIQVREDASADTVIGVVRAFDPDADQTIRFDIVGGTAANLLSVDPETGRVSLNAGAVLDFETTPTLTLELQVSDSAQPPLRVSDTVTVSLVDINEPPTIKLSRTEAVLKEVEFGTGNRVVATATLSDPENQPLKLEIIGGTGTDLVELTPQNEIRLKPDASLDFETRANWNIQLRVVEQTGGNPLSDVIQLNVRIVNENEAPIIANQAFNVFESSRPGTILAQLAFRDPDAGQRDQLTVLSGDTDILQLQSSGAIVLKNGATLDADLRPNLALKVRATDPLGLTTDADISIRVLTVNQPPRPTQILPPVVTSSATSFIINLPADLFVDADNNALTLSLSQVGATLPPWLTLDGVNRQIRGVPTPANAGKYQLLIQATDNGSPALTGVVPLSLELTPVPVPLHNTVMPLDVDEDSKVQSLDALVIINLLNQLPTGASSIVVPADGGGILGKPDVNQDNLITSLDALIVINTLSLGSIPAAEPEVPAFAVLSANRVDQFFNEDDEEEEQPL